MTVGHCPTATVTKAVSVKQLKPSKPTTLYVVVTNGDAVGFGMVALFKPDAGDQLYNVAPLASKLVDSPTQILSAEANVILIGCATVITKVSKAEQPKAFVPWRTYGVVTSGDATGLLQV